MAGLYKNGKYYYVMYYVGGKKKRISLKTTSFQIAKHKKQMVEQELARGQETPLPTQTPISKVVQDYIDFMETRKTHRSVVRDVNNLKRIFGPCCPTLLNACKSHPIGKVKTIEANCFEHITTAHVSEFLTNIVKTRGLAPRTANRYREILVRLFNWAMKQRGIKMPADKNPALQVERYRQKAPQIRFLTLPQIDEQLKALQFKPQLQTMVAMLIYAGLRREEVCWLTREDVSLRAGRFGMIRVRAKTVNGTFWQPKTGVNRAIPISSDLKRYLDSYTPHPSKGSWYFPTVKTFSYYDADNFSTHLRNANRKAGLKWSCLDFRHTFGSTLAMKGESLYKISKLMGNSPDICRRHYAALIPETLIESVEFTKKVV